MASVSGERIINLLNAKPMSGIFDVNESNRIEIHDVSFSYKESKVIDNVSLDINEKELTAFVGSLALENLH